MEFQQSQTNALNAQAAESQARAGKISVEAQLAPQELEIDRIEAITRNLKEGDAEDKEFERRLKVADRLLQEKKLKGNSNANDTNRNQQPAQTSQRGIQGPAGQDQQFANTIRQLGGEG